MKRPFTSPVAKMPGTEVSRCSLTGRKPRCVGSEAGLCQVEHVGVRHAADGEEHALGGEGFHFAVNLKRRGELRAVP